MFSEDFRTVLKTLTPITNSFIIENRMTFTDTYKQVVVSLDATKLGEDFGDQKIGLNDLSGFLSVVNLFEEPKISIKDKIINISDDHTSAKYLTSDLKSMKPVDYKIIETTKTVDTSLQFTLSQQVLEKVKKAASVFPGADTVFIICDETGARLEIGTDSTFEALSNTYSIEIDQSEGFETKTKVPLESFLKIPQADYSCEIKFNKEKNAKRVFLSNPLLEIILSVQK